MKLTGLVVSLAVIPVQTAAATGERTRIKEFCEARNTFDDLLRKAETKEDVEKVCGFFQDHLERLAAPENKNSKFLASVYAGEIERVKRARERWLVAPLEFARVRLDPNWMSEENYRRSTADLRTVLGVDRPDTAPIERPDILPGFGRGATVLGKPWLMPLDEFIKGFPGLKDSRATTTTKVKVSMPGFPSSSFFSHSFSGDFTSEARLKGGTFNRMYVVTDAWEQVVAVQFTCEAPKGKARMKYTGLRIYNFVQFRRKGAHDAEVHYATITSGSETHIHTALVDHGKAKELNVLVLPEPTRQLVEFLLRQ